jgi:geranylgeranyl diphosphate synthase type II
MPLACPVTNLIEETLADLLSPARFPLGKLAESARYATLAGGKRLRPRLVIATAEIYEVPLEATLHTACALELIHTYSLIHDDLPCMDNDDFRRGKPSLHKVYPEGHALLTGDFLLTYAFQVLAEAPHLSSDQRLALIATLATNAGANGMIGGQELDIASVGQTISWETLLLIHKNKTAALITAAIEFGGILGHSPQMELLRTIGEHVGLAFQIFDDLDDIDDLAQERPSAVTLLGAKQAKLYAETLIQSALNNLKSLSRKALSLELLIQEILSPSS